MGSSIPTQRHPDPDRGAPVEVVGRPVAQWGQILRHLGVCGFAGGPPLTTLTAKTIGSKRISAGREPISRCLNPELPNSPRDLLQVAARWCSLRGHQTFLRETDFVSPFLDILNLFPLIDLVNQIGSVVDQAHGRFSENPINAQTIHIGHTQAVEAKVRQFHFDEKLLPWAGGQGCLQSRIRRRRCRVEGRLEPEWGLER